MSRSKKMPREGSAGLVVMCVAMRPYVPPVVPRRPGSLRSSSLPSRIGDQYIYPRRATPLDPEHES